MPRPVRPSRPTSRLAPRLALLAALTPTPATAADPQPYTVALKPTGEAPLDKALSDTSNLVALREKAPLGPFALVTRAREDQSRLRDALGSFGYYNATVALRMAGRDIEDPTLPAALEAATGPVEIAIDIQRGPEFHLRRVTLTGPGAENPTARAALQLTPGQPARAAEIVAAEARILEALRNAGHALAKVSPPKATLQPAAQALDVAFDIEAGPQVDLGPITVNGLDRVNDSYVRRRLLIHQGQRFDPAKIEEARQDLASLGVFATVTANAAPTLDPNRQIPITIDVTERPRHVVAVTAAYSTDLGASAGVTWSHRNLFGNAERLDLGATATGAGGSATKRPGYNVTAALTKPDVFVRDQSVTISLQGVKESLDAYDRKAVLAGLQVTRKLSERWTVTAGLLAQQSRIAQEGVTRDYTLLGVPIGIRFDSTGPEGLFNPTSGLKAALTATPTASFKNSSEFVILQATGSTYFDLAAPGRSVIALRGTLAIIQGATTFQVPPDQRLYAGGSATVRGYKYQSVGPRFADRRPTGGASLAAASIEIRQRFGESLGAAIFIDAGQVGSDSSFRGADLKAGAGIGARYYTAIGPIRLDVAIPLNKEKGDDSFELYIGLGQAF